MGRPEFSLPGSKGSTEEVSTANEVAKSESVEFIDVSQTTSVPAGSSETVQVTAPSGFVYEILNVFLWVQNDADATGGENVLAVNDTDTDFRLLRGSGSFDTDVIYNRGYWQTANNSKSPSTEIAAQQVMVGLRLDETRGLAIKYQNDTDAAMDNDRQLRLWVRKIKVA